MQIRTNISPLIHVEQRFKLTLIKYYHLFLAYMIDSKASKELKCKNLLIITKDYDAEERIDNNKIKFMPLWKWLID